MPYSAQKTRDSWHTITAPSPMFELPVLVTLMNRIVICLLWMERDFTGMA